MSSRLALVKRLAGLTWGASFGVLRVSTLALLVSPAEYCAPVWTQCAHTNKLNTPFNEALRTISGCIRSTRTSFLPILAGIESLENRRRNACQRLFHLASDQDHPLHQMMYCSRKLSRLRSRHPLRNLVDNLPLEDNPVPKELAELIPEWTKHPPGCELPRQQWVQLNRLRSQAGKFAADMFRWGFTNNRSCPCGAEKQTYNHVLQECPLLKPPCSLEDVDNPSLHKYLDNCNF